MAENTSSRIHFEVIDSTNAYCLREVGRLESGTVVTADTQTAGRGRRGREWYSPSRVNLYLSILLKPPFLNAHTALFPHVASLAIFDVVRGLGVDGAWIKWPNDVMAGTNKLAGVLCETRGHDDRVEAMVVGIGLNLNMSAEDAARIDRGATSVLLETGRDTDCEQTLESLLACFNRYYTNLQTRGFDELYAPWCEASELVGRRVTVEQDTKKVSGTVEGFARDGGIILELEDGGGRVTIVEGDVSLCAVQGMWD